MQTTTRERNKTNMKVDYPGQRDDMRRLSNCYTAYKKADNVKSQKIWEDKWYELVKMIGDKISAFERRRLN